MNISFHPHARAELRQAAAWYEAERVGLGDDVIAAVEHAVSVIRETPDRWPRVPYEPRARRYLIRRFPFAICYAIVGDVLFIVAVAHVRREPGYWSRRLDDAP